MLNSDILKSLINTLYELQKIRGLIFLYKFEDESEKNYHITKINKDISLLLSPNLQYKFLNNFSSLIKEDGYLNFDFFINYTNTLIVPTISAIKHIILTTHKDQEARKYISLINIIENISFQYSALKKLDPNSSQCMIVINNIFDTYKDILKGTFNLDVDINTIINNSNFNTNKNLFLLVDEFINVIIEFANILYLKLTQPQKISTESEKREYALLKKLLTNKLSENSINILIAHGKLLHLNKQDELTYHNNDFCICLSGLLKAYLIDEEGSEFIIDLFDNGSCFYDHFFVNNTKVEALKNNTIIFTIPNTTLNYLRENFIDISLFLHKKLFNIVIEKNLYIENIVAKKVKDRLAYLLVKYQIDNKNIKFSKYNVARYLNMRPETFSRALKDLEQEKEHNEHYLCNYCTKDLAEKCVAKKIMRNICSHN